MPESWERGRAIVYAEHGVVEYFDYDEGGKARTICGGLREYDRCRPLDYVLDAKTLARLECMHEWGQVPRGLAAERGRA